MKKNKFVSRERKPVNAFLWFEDSQDFERALRKAWPGAIEARAADLMVKLANLENSPEQIQQFRDRLPASARGGHRYDIAAEHKKALLTLRDELRAVWDELSREQGIGGGTSTPGDQSTLRVILDKWWSWYPLEKHSQHWKIFWESGSFFPLQHNFRGIIARICFDERKYLAICSHCGKYWIKPRYKSKFCMSDE